MNHSRLLDSANNSRRLWRKRLQPRLLDSAKMDKSKALDIFEKLESRRRDWTLSPEATPEQAAPAAEYGDIETIGRILALRVLEIPVKEFILDGIERPDRYKLTLQGVLSLQRNTLDEDNHDKTLNAVAKKYEHYGIDHSYIASEIRKTWVEFPSHPILKAAVLENGVFFTMLPFMRKYGGNSLNSSAWNISQDEAIHVASHRTAANLLGLKLDKQLDDLRKLTVEWIFQDSSKGADFYLNRSDNLISSGKASANFGPVDSDEGGNYTVDAFYETSNSDLWY
ncbi:MAG: hypothetical protein F6J86_26900 [Symploca sp. SIO1B1]|nr:hypothetical protein [Symploca sp. SIO1B1]